MVKSFANSFIATFLLTIISCSLTSYPGMVIFIDRSGSMEPHWENVMRCMDELLQTYPRLDLAVFCFDTICEEVYSGIADSSIVDAIYANRPSLRKARLRKHFTGNFTHLGSIIESALSSKAKIALIISDGLSDPAPGFVDISMDSLISLLEKRFEAVHWIVSQAGLEKVKESIKKGQVISIDELWTKKLIIKPRWSWWLPVAILGVLISSASYYSFLYIKIFIKYNRRRKC